MATIKGLFIKAQVDRVRSEKGDESVLQLAKRYGSSVDFSSFKNYPVEDEERLIKACIQILPPKEPIDDADLAAGRFHFQTFLKNQIAKIVFSIASEDPKRMFFEYVPKIILSVFDGITLEVADVDPTTIMCTMRGSSGYPLRHWEGFWGEYFKEFGFDFQIESKVLSPGCYEYRVHWKHKA